MKIDQGFSFGRDCYPMGETEPDTIVLVTKAGRWILTEAPVDGSLRLKFQGEGPPPVSSDRKRAVVRVVNAIEDVAEKGTGLDRRGELIEALTALLETT